MTYAAAENRYEHLALPPRRHVGPRPARRSPSACGRSSAPTTPFADAAGDHPARVRPGHHALRQRRPLRPAAPRRAAELRPGAAPRTSRRTATRSSCRRRPATRSARARTCAAARASRSLSSLDHSLRDLGTDYVDIFYHHSPDLSHAAGGDGRRAGQRRAAGQGALRRHLQLPARPVPAQAAELLREAGVPLLVHQARYSIFDRRVEQNGAARGGRRRTASA